MKRTHTWNCSRTLLLPLLAIALTALAGCGVAPAFLVGADVDPQAADAFAKLTYPKAAAIGEHLDIVAVKSGNELTLTNRTPRAFANVQLWINQQYVCVVDAIPVGERKVLALNTFINEHGEAFPVGGLLNPERSYRLVLAEVYEPGTGGRRHRILVRTDEASTGQ